MTDYIFLHLCSQLEISVMESVIYRILVVSIWFCSSI